MERTVSLSDEVVGGHGEGELPVDLGQPPVTRLALFADRLGPAYRCGCSSWKCQREIFYLLSTFPDIGSRRRNQLRSHDSDAGGSPLVHFDMRGDNCKATSISIQICVIAVSSEVRCCSEGMFVTSFSNT